MGLPTATLPQVVSIKRLYQKYFKYFDTEHVLTSAVHTKTCLTLGYHRFRQVYPAPFLREARIEADPTGDSKDIGEELSLLAELRTWENLEIDLAAAIFESGDAFGISAGELAKTLFVKLA